jgi:hypothetical protein
MISPPVRVLSSMSFLTFHVHPRDMCCSRPSCARTGCTQQLFISEMIPYVTRTGTRTECVFLFPSFACSHSQLSTSIPFVLFSNFMEVFDCCVYCRAGEAGTRKVESVWCYALSTIQYYNTRRTYNSIVLSIR